MQCACVILSSVACPVLQYFSTLPHKLYNFRKKKIIKPKICVSNFSVNCVWNICHSKKKLASYDKKNVYWSSCKVPRLFLSDFNKTWICATEFRKKTPNTKFHENPSSGAPSCSVRTDGRTGMTELVVAFRNFAAVPKNVTVRLLCTGNATWWNCCLSTSFTLHNASNVLNRWSSIVIVYKF